MQTSRAFALLAVLALLPSVAHADPKDDARRHFSAGLRAANDGDMEVALQRFLAAQAAYPHPATLYNIGRTYADLGDFSNALIYYRQYREQANSEADNVDPIIAAMEARTGIRPDEITTGTVAKTNANGEVDDAQLISESEASRLEEIALELEALSDSFDRRGAESTASRAANAATAMRGLATGEAVDFSESGVELPTDISELDLEALGVHSFIEGAYDKQVVSASRVAQDPLASPSTITVLTSEDIRMSGAQTLPDLLRRVVGVDVMSNTAGHSDVSIRGFNRKAANKVLVLIDGRSTYADFNGLTFWAGLPISMEEIEKVEIIRGPGSSVYGANAMTGVINIITRAPGDEPGQVLAADLGSYKIARGTVMTSGTAGTTSYRFTAGYQQQGRFARDYKASDFGPDRALNPAVDNQDLGMQVVRGNGRVDQQFGSKGFASMSAGIAGSTYEYLNQGALPNYALQRNDTYVRGDLSWGVLHLRSFWNAQSGVIGPWTEQVGQNQSLAGPLDNDAVDVEIEAPLTFTTGAIDHTLNVGTGYRYKRVDFGRYFNDIVRTENHTNAFFNEQIAVGKFGAVASFRADNHPLLPIAQTLSPRGALLFRVFDRTALRATYGKAFRAPNALESYMDFSLPSPIADGVFLRNVGDQNLSAERISTFELGVHDESSDLHTADVVVYQNTVRDLIGLLPLDLGISPFNTDVSGFERGRTGWTNLAPTYTGTGIEAELEVYPADGLDVYGNVDVQQIMINDDGTKTSDRSVSTFKANLGTMYRAPFRMDFTYDLNFVNSQTWSLRAFDRTGGLVSTPSTIPSRLLMSARIAGRPFEDEKIELAATFWNLTGSRFIEHPDAQPVRSRVFGSVIYKF